MSGFAVTCFFVVKMGKIKLRNGFFIAAVKHINHGKNKRFAQTAET